MALTNALCACAGHYHCVAIAVDRVHLSVLVCVYLYVPHDAMPCPVMLRAMVYDATRWSAMPRDTYNATCDATRCPEATRCHAMPHSTWHCTLHDTL